MSNDTLTVAPGGIVDIDAVMAVMDDSFDPAFGEAWTAAQCAGLLPLPGVWLSLARRGSEVVGFSLSRMTYREAELLLLAVRRDGQRQGVGRLLLAAFAEEARHKGAERLHLEVRDGNVAVKLYAKFGFNQIGRRKHYYRGRSGQVFDALTLAKPASD